MESMKSLQMFSLTEAGRVWRRAEKPPWTRKDSFFHIPPSVAEKTKAGIIHFQLYEHNSASYLYYRKDYSKDLLRSVTALRFGRDQLSRASFLPVISTHAFAGA